jgi:hypothetical protein
LATVLTTVGKGIVTGRMIGGASPSQAEPKFIGMGSGAGTAVVGDTTLSTEYTSGTWSGYARTSTAGVQVTTSVANDTVQWQGTFTAPSAQTVTNAGNFDASTVGNLCVHGDFTGVVLNTNDTIQITIKIQFT